MVEQNRQLGDFLRKKRKEKKLTLVEASKKIGMSRSLLSAIERGLKPLTIAYYSKVIDVYNLNNEDKKILSTLIVPYKNLEKLSFVGRNVLSSSDFEAIRKMNIELGKTLINLGKFSAEFAKPIIEATNKFAENFVSPMSNMLESMANNIKPFVDISKQLSAKLAKVLPNFTEIASYINILEKLSKNRIPIYFYLEDEYIKEILSGKKDNISKKDIDNIVNHFDTNKISGIFKQWKKYDFIDNERKNIFDEALALYKESKYYSFVALLLTQTDWVIATAAEINKENISLSEKNTKEIVAEFRNIDINKVSKLPGNTKMALIKLYGNTNEHLIVWYYASQYLYNEVYASARWSKDVPCRNKILHGVQISYGTKEHAVKAVLALDIAFRLHDINFKDSLVE